MHSDTTTLVVLCTAGCDHARNGLSGNIGQFLPKFSTSCEMVSLGILSSYCASD